MLLSRLQTRIDEQFGDLHFEEERHLYWINTGHTIEYLPSTSSKVEHYIPPFNEELWLRRCAKKEGITEAELAHKWQTINKEACVLGTETHDFLEKWDGFRTATTPQEEAGLKFLKDIRERYIVVRKEIRMYHKVFRYAGTSDLLLYDTKTDSLVIADYKTNKDLWKNFDMMKEPFSYLQSHPYNHYQLQLSFYQLMLEQLQYPISNRMIVYLDPLGNYKTYDTYYFGEELTKELTKQRIAA